MQINYKMSFIIKDSFKRFCQHFVCAYHWLFLGHYSYIESHNNKKHIFEYVCKTWLKELAINTGKPLKNIAASNIFKKSAIFLPYFFKQVTPIEHLPMVISGNVTKYAYYTNLNNIYMVHWLIMVVPVKFLSWLNSYVNS